MTFWTIKRSHHLSNGIVPEFIPIQAEMPFASFSNYYLDNIGTITTEFLAFRELSGEIRQ